MDNEKIINLMFKILENAVDGHITPDEETILFYEMKTRQEYAKRHFK